MRMQFRGKAITVLQPWASAIAFAGKDVENRDWPTRYRGPLAIHAGARFSSDDLLVRITKRTVCGRRIKTISEWIDHGATRLGLTSLHGELPASCVIAIAMMTACVSQSQSVWFGGTYGFQLDGVIPIEPFSMTGALGLWNCRFDYVLLVP
jgi:hypothetical protein